MGRGSMRGKAGYRSPSWRSVEAGASFRLDRTMDRQRTELQAFGRLGDQDSVHHLDATGIDDAIQCVGKFRVGKRDRLGIIHHSSVQLFHLLSEEAGLVVIGSLVAQRARQFAVPGKDDGLVGNLAGFVVGDLADGNDAGKTPGIAFGPRDGFLIRPALRRGCGLQSATDFLERLDDMIGLFGHRPHYLLPVLARA